MFLLCSCLLLQYSCLVSSLSQVGWCRRPQVLQICLLLVFWYLNKIKLDLQPRSGREKPVLGQSLSGLFLSSFLLLHISESDFFFYPFNALNRPFRQSHTRHTCVQWSVRCSNQESRSARPHSHVTSSSSHHLARQTRERIKVAQSNDAWQLLQNSNLTSILLKTETRDIIDNKWHWK